MTGAGLTEAGLDPCGLGAPTENEQLYVSSLKLSVGGCVSSVSINSRTGDFEIDDYGSEEAMSDSAQRVYCLLKQNFVIPPTTANLADAILVNVRDALAPAIDDNSITLDSVDVGTDVTKALAVVWWTDKRTKHAYSANVPLRQ